VARWVIFHSVGLLLIGSRQYESDLNVRARRGGVAHVVVGSEVVASSRVKRRSTVMLKLVVSSG